MTDKPTTTGTTASDDTTAPSSDTTDPFAPRPATPLRHRMIEDMAARNLNRHTQRSHLSSCKRFAAWLMRSPDTATADEVRLFQLHLIESGSSIGNRNRIMSGVKFLLKARCAGTILQPRSGT